MLKATDVKVATSGRESILEPENPARSSERESGPVPCSGTRRSPDGEDTMPSIPRLGLRLAPDRGDAWECGGEASDFEPTDPPRRPYGDDPLE